MGLSRRKRFKDKWKQFEILKSLTFYGAVNTFSGPVTKRVKIGENGLTKFLLKTKIRPLKSQNVEIFGHKNV